MMSTRAQALAASLFVAAWVGFVYFVGTKTGWLTTGPLKIERFGLLCLGLAVVGFVWMWFYYPRLLNEIRDKTAARG